jgi:O-antigen ligase
MGNWRSKSLDRSFVAVCGVSAIIMVGCWILTKSRTAWLATAMGVALLGLQAWRRGWRMPSWKITAFVVVGLALVAASVTAIGGLDKLVLTESQKSLAYRFEYWRASWAMIADHPWLGCGPGNFQQYYTKYKLPEASEEISDPHNFVLEVWATAGTPAVIAFVAMLAVFAWQAWHILNETTSAEAERPSADQGTTRSDSGGRAPRAALHAAPSETAEGSVRSVYWGALGGVLFAYFPCGFLVDIMPSSALLVVAVPFTALVLALWNGWTTRGELPTSALVVCIVGLLVNLLAAGGISFAGVSMSLWLLMALTLHPSNQSTPPRPMGRFAGLTLVLSALALSMTYVVTQWQPVLTRSALLAQGERDWREGRADHAERSFVEATAADPLDVEPWMNLAALRHQRWLQTVDPQSWKGFETAAQSMLARSRRSSALHERYGDWLLAAYRRTNDKQHLRDAIGAYRRAVELYPNHSLTRAQCAWALSLANDVEEARTGAEEAIRLDSLHMHREQKLAVVPLFDPGLPDGERNAEHLMHKLRNAKRT